MLIDQLIDTKSNHHPSRTANKLRSATDNEHHIPQAPHWPAKLSNLCKAEKHLHADPSPAQAMSEHTARTTFAELSSICKHWPANLSKLCKYEKHMRADLSPSQAVSESAETAD